MADVPEVSVASQTTPARTVLSDTVGARSAYDSVSPQAASAAALDAAVNQMVSDAGAVGAGVIGVGGVARTTTQMPGFPPVTVHTAGISYTIPLGGQ